MFQENTRAYFGDFGTEATLGSLTVRGLFVAPYGESFGGLVAGSSPVFQIDSSVTVAEGDTLTIAGTAYSVVEIHRDGTAVSVLTLEKA